MGVSGAYILAGEIAKNVNDPKAAAAGFEQHMRPIVKEIQALPPGMPGLLFQETAWGNRIFCNILRVVSWLAGSKLVRNVAESAFRIWGRFFPSVQTKKLPEYEEYIVNPVKGLEKSV